MGGETMSALLQLPIHFAEERICQEGEERTALLPASRALPSLPRGMKPASR